MKKLLISAILVVCLLSSFFLLSGCSPFYVMRAAYEEGKILINREPIDEVIDSQSTTKERILKLQYVLKARTFADNRLQLNVGNSYTSYSEIDREILAWVLLASRKDAFEPYTWWYPIVGTVPYKGYFEKDDASCDLERLEKRGYETWLRTTSAFSTLGWFDDPVLSTTLQSSIVDIVNTVIHEIFHRTIWIPDAVDFNETAANFVGTRATVDFFQEELETCEAEDCREKASALLEESERMLAFEMQASTTLGNIYESLNTLYRSDIPQAEILEQREEIFNREIAPLRRTYPQLRTLKSINNAEIMQLYLYRKELKLFDDLFQQCHNNWACFLDELRQLEEKTETEVYERLRMMVEE